MSWMAEDKMVGWHHWIDGHEFEQAPGVGDGQGSLVCCSPWDLKESDTTEWLNWTIWDYSITEGGRLEMLQAKLFSYSVSFFSPGRFGHIRYFWWNDPPRLWRHHFVCLEVGSVFSYYDMVSVQIHIFPGKVYAAAPKLTSELRALQGRFYVGEVWMLFLSLKCF